MNIVSALKTKTCMRVLYDDKWLVYVNNEWVVYQRKHGFKRTRIICTTQIQDKAIEVLCGPPNKEEQNEKSNLNL